MFMSRALQLAELGRGLVSPNPMVGAVIVRDGRIIGEGYHHRFGGPHAEVNAVDSVSDKALLRDSTIYVTLEPCSHYGKTPPCAQLLVDCGFKRVVVGCPDPNPRVSGRGIALLSQSGIEVMEGVLEQECRRLNERFMVSQIQHRPYIQLKWACSADGFLDRRRAATEAAARFSTPRTMQLVHMLRAEADAIIVGSGTVALDNPRLDVRLVSGRNPLRVVLDRRNRVQPGANLFHGGRTLYVSEHERSDLPPEVEQVCCHTLPELIAELGRRNVGTVMVEGGATLLASFIRQGLWDEARIEIANGMVLGEEGAGYLAVPEGVIESCSIDGNTIVNVKNRETAI